MSSSQAARAEGRAGGPAEADWIPVCPSRGNPYKPGRMHDTIVLIPARMAATRLPGKPLIDIHGEPMIAHVVRRAQQAAIGEVVVATDSEPVAVAVEKAGGRALMTGMHHPSGSDRIYEALTELDPE